MSRLSLQASRKGLYALYAILAILLLLSATYRLLDISERVDELRHGDALVRDPFDVDLPEFVLQSVDREAAAAGFKANDRVTAINRQPIRYSAADLWVPLRAARPGDRLHVEAERRDGGTLRTVSGDIVLQPLRTGPPTLFEVGRVVLLNIVMPCCCAVVGFWVAAARVRDRRAWLILFLMLSVAEFSGGDLRFLYGRTGALQPILTAYQPLLANLWPLAMLLFAVAFPDRLALDRRAPWLKWLVIAPVLVWVIGTNPVFEYVGQRSPAAALRVYERLEPLQPYVRSSYLGFILLFFAIMAFRTATERQPDARRRLLLLDAGLGASVLPMAVFLVLFVTQRGAAGWLLSPALACLGLFPLTMAYVIVVERAMDVRVVIRTGLRYLLARGTLRVVQLALMVAVSAGAAALVFGAGSLPVQAAVVSIGMLALVAIRTSARTLAVRVDRRFFREAYDAEQILADLADDVRMIVDTGVLVRTVAERIARALHIPRVAIFLNEAGSFQIAHAVGFAEVPALVLDAQGGIVERLTQEPYVSVDAGDDTQSPAAGDEQRAWRVVDADVVLPLASNRQMLGLISLSPKQSEEPYSRTDLRLLRAVATQTGLALANGRLTIQIAAAIAEREKQKRELEIAREVQQRLFPQERPAVQGLDYAGACRPALAVGGDYYDFIQRSPGELGIAIGDISGKGIPAALLMATLRAFLRGQTVNGQTDLAGMMLNLNTLVYESSAANRYATFFFGHYDAATRTLRYVNAGHNAPMLVRCASGDGDVERLDVGGPVIGLLPFCRYEAASVRLDRGDVLVAFTDGISEAMDVDGDEWGEPRLLEAIRSARNRGPLQVIEHVMAAADAFAGAAPQHDDMTMVIARLA